MEFNEENVLINVDVQDRLALFEYISDYALIKGIVKNKEKLVEAFLEREKEGSTGLQDSFAIPHAKSDFVIKPAIIFLKLKKPIQWETFDDRPVANVFALLVPKECEGTVHLQMISNIATLLLEEEFTNFIKNTEDIHLLKKEISKAMTDQ